MRRLLVAALVAVSGWAGVPVAAADTGDLTYGCAMPDVGAVSLGVVVREQLPVRAWPRVPTAPFLVSTEVSVPAEVAAALRADGVRAVRGHLELSVAFADEARGVGGDIPETAVPDEGGFAFTAHGVFPRHVFDVALGLTEFSAGEATVTWSVSDGRQWSEPVEFGCAPAPGQDRVMGAVRVDNVIDERPPRPVITRTATDPGTVTVEWTASSTLLPIRDYAVYVGHDVVATVLQPRATITGLRPDTEYPVTVRSRDTIGQESDASVPVFVRTAPDRLVYRVTGAAVLGPWRADLPVAGALSATLDGGTLTATGALDASSATVWGGMRVAVEFGPAEITGALADGVLTGRLTTTLSAPTISWFGTPHPTPDCRAAAPVDIPLSGPLTGVSGAFTMPEFVGCGWLTGYVNTAFAGTGTLRVGLASNP
ncbi:fibronectin type III domain-containing protein [Actinokineospora fastidiosa]|uniref:Fibronectin type-III domain-containing protein n=1 Tax=Actinokineospora fastidiosa TaxID=1816 RepID=A0A918GH67_9PSEU|nr:fibronectin type III domain-containing protein [Actinokineospora fastidiosa]GGS35551.1 hypothetical protein GCM10010171_32660 [Actinokineospora fastidiosa]